MHAELGRVYVDGDEYVGGFGGGLADQGEVTVVQGAHCGDEADGAVVEEELASVFAEKRDFAEDLGRGSEAGFGGESSDSYKSRLSVL